MKTTAFSIQYSAFRNKKLVILIVALVFHFSLFTFHFSLSFAESLSDIKINALQAPIKEKWGRDPFIRHEEKIIRRGVQVEELPIDLKVEGIIADREKSLAIINGGFYRKNDKVNGFLIVDIARDKVLLEKNGKKFYLDIKKFAIESVPMGGKK
jgi:type II secretory pathway component PulC